MFVNDAGKYYDKGINVILCNGKKPLIRRWQRWGTQIQTQEEFDSQMRHAGTAHNTGSALGLWACAVDVDTDDPEILATVQYSPIRRRGQKGLIAVYAPCEHSSRSPDVPLEFLNVGRQMILPRSLHPIINEEYI